MKRKIVLFAVIAMISITASAQSHAGHAKPAQSTQSAQSTQKHAMLKVQGSCDMCKTRIEKAALSVKGVSSATWDGQTKDLHLNYDASKTNLDAISKAIAKVGHDTEKDKADDKVYNALPGCCKYRK